MSTTKLSFKDISRAEAEVDKLIQLQQSRLTKVRQSRFNTSTKAGLEGEVAVANFRENMEVLLTVRFDIRRAKDLFKAESGINSKVATIAMLESLLSNVEECCAGFGDLSAQVDMRSNSTFYKAGISTKAEDKYLSEARSLRRKIQSLKDSCNGINAQSEVSTYLNPGTIDFLQEHNLID